MEEEVNQTIFAIAEWSMLLISLFQVPAKPNYSLVLYYAADRPIKKNSLLARFVDGNDMFREARFKLIPSIVEVLNAQRIMILQNLSHLYQFCPWWHCGANNLLRGTGVLDGQACCWNKSLLTGESRNLQIFQTRQLSGGKTSKVLFHIFQSHDGN